MRILPEKALKIILQVLLLGVIALVPFVKTDSLYFPFVSGKAYLFRSLMAAAFFFWVWLLLYYKQYRPNIKNILVVAILLFFVGQVVASFFGVDALYSLFSSIERADGVLQYGFWVLYFLMIMSVFRTWQDWRILFSAFAVAALALSIYSWLDHEMQTQLYGVFGNPAYFAAFLLFAIGFSLVVVERKFFSSRWINYAFLGATAFFSFTLIFTQIRGVYVALAGGIFLFCLLSILFLRKENKKLAYFCAAVLLLGALSLGALFAAKETSFVQDTHILSRVTEATEIWTSASTRERLLNWSIALKAFEEKPVFGYGPENFGSAANKYYDYRIGQGEPWFDRAHNQPLDTLATGGIVVFSLYLFWLAITGILIFKIGKAKKMLSFLLAALFFAYFVQGLFLFDLLAVYIGLFPFFAFLLWQYNAIYKKKEEQQLIVEDSASTPHAPVEKRGANLFIIMLAGVVSLFVIYATVFIPYKANTAAIHFFAFSESGFFKESKPFVEEAFAIESPYATWEVRKRAGWQLMQLLEYQVSEETPPEKLAEIQELYDVITPELERFIEARPYDPQLYYVLARTYRFGSQKLGRNDLEKAELVLMKGFEHSDRRVEYFNEFSQILLLQGKFDEAEQSVKDYTARVSFFEYFPSLTLGHFYFVAKEYEQAFEQYEKAREAGYRFYEITPEYARYMFAAEETKNYQQIIDMASSRLERWGPDADTYFNIAVGYFNTDQKEKANEYYLKALELNADYQEYEAFFQ